MLVGMSLAWTQNPIGSSLLLLLVTVMILTLLVLGPLALQEWFLRVLHPLLWEISNSERKGKCD